MVRGLTALLLAISSLTSPGRSRAAELLLSGVYFEGLRGSDPQADEAIRLERTAGAGALDLGGYQLAAGPAAAGTACRLHLPAGLKLSPGEHLWVAREAQGFRASFGFAPAVEVVATDPAVPDAGGCWPPLGDLEGRVVLQAPDGQVIDAVAYAAGVDATAVPFPGPLDYWRGPAVRLTGATPWPWRGFILGRDRSPARGAPVDTDTAGDWTCAFSPANGGSTCSLERPGQSHLAPSPIAEAKTTLRCGAAPESALEVVTDLFRGARRSILLATHQLTSEAVVVSLVEAAARGVQVELLVEGAPAGGLTGDARATLERLTCAGARVWIAVAPGDRPDDRRYRQMHASYAAVDDATALLGTENFSRTGLPEPPQTGNRGFVLAIEQPELALQLAALWKADVASGVPEIVALAPSSCAPAPAPASAPAPSPPGRSPRGRLAPVIKGRMGFTLGVTPDQPLTRDAGLLGLIEGARYELWVSLNSAPLYWGRRGSGARSPDNPLLLALMRAAERGVRVRLVLDGSWYHVEAADDRDNDNTVAYLNRWARREQRDLVAKVANLPALGVAKLHAKAVVADGARAYVGTLDWSEQSVKLNREIGVVVQGRDLAGWLRRQLARDWLSSPIYRVDIRGRGVAVLREPSQRSRVQARVERGARLDVVGEVGGRRNPAYLEVRLGKESSGYLPSAFASLPVVDAAEASLNIGRQVQVEGVVREVEQRPELVLLKLGAPPGCEAVIFRPYLGKFTHLGADLPQAVTGKRVAVRGVLRTYEAPELILSKPSQLMLLED